MPKNDIGGFFVHLGVDVDKDSFEKGNKLVDGISDSFNKLIGTARNAMVVLASWKTIQDIAATGALENQIYMDSEAMGVETEVLNEWIASAKIAGVNSDGLVNSMGRLANVLNHITIDGSGIEAYAAQLGKLRIGIADLEKLNDPAAAYELIIATAQERAAEAQQKIVEARNALELNPRNRKARNDLEEAQKEKQRITVIVGDILGSAGQDYFIKLQNRKLSVADALQEAGKTQFTDAQDTQNGMNFLTEWNTLSEEFKSIKRLLGDEAGGIASPYLKQFNEWIQINGPEIKTSIKNISDVIDNTISKGVENISEWWDSNGDDVKSYSSAVAENIRKLVDHFAGAGEGVLPKFKETGKVLIDSVQKTTEGMTKMANALSEGDGKGFVNATFETASAAVGEPLVAIANGIEDLLIDNQGYKDRTTINTETKKIWDEKYGDHPYLNQLKRIPFDDLPEDLQKGILKIRETDKNWHPNTVKMKDGIMRPDGTVTQVAPDDWVIAARNLGDVAEAFRPQENKLQQVAPDTNGTLSHYISMLVSAFVPQIQQQAQVSGGEYTINQTFNINGGNDMPQIIRQQAYNGAQSGLLDLMNQSSRRLQLMSGTM